ncbi:MAG: Nif3-like dinuclear metal center hexameric protein [Oscillospiraceae bacterium]|nr:Nif3-like dinuclear metal center hexameric protein [Oscillospiraceae bacterium]
MTVQDIYNAVDAFAPFATQERWDNSGLLVGSPGCAAEKVLVSLDISPAAVQKAAELGCDVIVSHHPVIFTPMKTLPTESPVYALAKSGIAAICCHTPLDIAAGGINDLLVERLRAVLELSAETEPLDEVGCGRIVTFPAELPVKTVAEAAKTALGCSSVRFSAGERYVKRLGICSGSGSSMLEEIAGTCDALLTGDVKHDRWYKAEELGLGLIDCGHYHTEILMVPYTAQKLREAVHGVEVFEFVEGDPCCYV